MILLPNKSIIIQVTNSITRVFTNIITIYDIISSKLINRSRRNINIRMKSLWKKKTFSN